MKEITKNETKTKNKKGKRKRIEKLIRLKN
jgi:hypothetical protein